jgi:hypothetical protein
LLIPANIITSSPLSVPAVITTSAGAVSVKGIFENHPAPETADRYSFTLGNPMLTIATADCEDIRQDYQVTVKGRNYKINDYQVDDIGVTVMELVYA